MKRPLWAAAVAGLSLAAGCGGAPSVRLIVPQAVPTDLAPAVLPGAGLTMTEFPAARKAFAQVGATSLVSDGRLWQLRQGSNLVGTLQISTVKRDVSVDKPADRKAITDGVMTGLASETIDVNGIAVTESVASDKTLFLWFGPGYFEVLQLKADRIDPEGVVTTMIKDQEATGHLTPVKGTGDNGDATE